MPVKFSKGAVISAHVIASFYVLWPTLYFGAFSIGCFAYPSAATCVTHALLLLGPSVLGVILGFVGHVKWTMRAETTPSALARGIGVMLVSLALMSPPWFVIWFSFG